DGNGSFGDFLNAGEGGNWKLPHLEFPKMGSWFGSSWFGGGGGGGGGGNSGGGGSTPSVPRPRPGSSGSGGGRGGFNFAGSGPGGLVARLDDLARYAPLDEPLTPDELIEARQLVCGLAGVSY